MPKAWSGRGYGRSIVESRVEFKRQRAGASPGPYVGKESGKIGEVLG